MITAQSIMNELRYECRTFRSVYKSDPEWWSTKPSTFPAPTPRAARNQPVSPPSDVNPDHVYIVEFDTRHEADRAHQTMLMYIGETFNGVPGGCISYTAHQVSPSDIERGAQPGFMFSIVTTGLY